MKRSHLRLILDRLGWLATRQLRGPLTLRELADMDTLAAEALAVAAAFNRRHPHARPFTGDDELEWACHVRSEAQRRMEEKHRNSREAR